MYTLIKLNTRDKVCEIIRQHRMLFDSFDSVYLFGSILYTTGIPNDIDILLIYEKYSSKIINDSSLICSALEKLSGLPVDLTVLSFEEEKNTNFLKRINSLCLKLK